MIESILNGSIYTLAFALGFQEILIIGVIILIFFGGARFVRGIPNMAKSLGEGIREFRKAGAALKEPLEELEQAREELDEATEKVKGVAGKKKKGTRIT